MPLSARSWQPRRAAPALTAADLAGCLMAAAAVFIFLWWLRFWLAGWIWLGTRLWGIAP